MDIKCISVILRMSVKIVSLPDNFLYFCREKTGSVGSYPADELNF